jgi:hypothetical protein
MGYFSAPQGLRDLAYRYALAVDTRDVGMIVSIFTAEGILRNFADHPLQYGGLEGFTRMMQDMGMFERTMHSVSNQVFDQAADGTVTGLTYCLASHLLPGSPPVKVDMGIIYHDLYRETDNEWRYAQRRIEVLWIERSPVHQLPAHSITRLEDAFQA